MSDVSDGFWVTLHLLFRKGGSMKADFAAEMPQTLQRLGGFLYVTFYVGVDLSERDAFHRWRPSKHDSKHALIHTRHL